MALIVCEMEEDWLCAGEKRRYEDIFHCFVVVSVRGQT